MNIEPNPEDMAALGEVLGRILNADTTLSEKQKAEMDMMKLVHQSFDSDVALHRIADTSQGKVEQDTADVFAAGVMALLMEQGIVPGTMNRVLFLYGKAAIAHWFRTFEIYTKGGEI